MDITCVFLVIYQEDKLQSLNKTNNNFKSKIISAFLLLLASVVWGAAFVAQSVAGESVGTFSFNGIRFLIGGLCMLPLLPRKSRLSDEDSMSSENVIGATKNSGFKMGQIKGGILCGLALFFASTCQQAGIAAGASAGEAGFITAFYIILVPVLGLFLGKKCSKLVALAVAIAITGLYFLCFDSFGELVSSGIKVLSFADIMLLGCAFLFSIQILGVDHYAPKMNPVVLSCAQFFTTGIISLICGIFFELIPDPVGWFAALSSFKAWIPILYTGIFSSAVGYTLQVVGQRNLNPAVASLIMSMESVFSTIFGWLILKQMMSGRKLLGCGLVFAAILLAQFPTRSRVAAIKKNKQQK